MSINRKSGLSLTTLTRHAMWAAVGCTVLVGGVRGLAAQEGEAAGDEIVLQPIVVQGEVDDATTEGSESFTSPTATVAGKSPTRVRDIPQALSVVTDERIEQLNMTQLEDAARWTTGMLVLTNDPGRSSIFTRGFELDTVTIEGLPAPLSSIYGTQQDLAIADRVEFLRGPSGLFTGAGEISGIANIGLKQAYDEFGAQGIASVGSWSNYRAEADVNVPLTQSGAANARVVAAYQERDSFVDVDYNEVNVVYGTLGAELGSDTTLDVYVWQQNRDSIPFNGLPTDTSLQLLDIDRSTFVGASWNRFDNHVFDSIAQLAHEFGDGITANLGVRYSKRDVDMAYAYGLTAVDPAVGTTNLRGFARTYDEDVFSADANVQVPVQAFGRTHDIVVGLDYRYYEQTMRQAIVNNIFAYNVYQPNPDAVPEPVFNYTTQTENKPEQIGLYAQTRLRATDRLAFVLGARETWYQDETLNLITGAVTNKEDIDGEFTPFAGVTFDVSDNWTAFASFAEIFQPQANVTTPITGQQYEAGLKFEYFGGALNGAISAFQLNQKNRSVLDPVSLDYYAGGEVRSQGFEAEISGNVTENIDMFAGYAFTETEYTNDPTIPPGTIYSTITPKHLFQLWTRYSFDHSDGFLDGAYIAGGARASSSFSSGAIDAPGYVVFDAQIGHQLTEYVSAALTLSNVLDTTYYSRVGAPGLFNFYGPPRNLLFTLNATF
jgi:outer membrane receptor for ferric coprogen and ferric-rhodotorulic acid